MRSDVKGKAPVRESGVVHLEATVPATSMGKVAQKNAVESLSPQVQQERSGFPGDLNKLRSALNAQKNRTIDTVNLAKVLQDVRFHALKPSAKGAVTSNGELVRKISNTQLRDWYTALGITEHQIKGMESAAFWAGKRIPTSGTIFNLISYLVVPFATQSIKNPWNSAFISLSVVAAQPLITAPLQSLIIGAIDYYRRKDDVDVKVDKGIINSRFTQSEVKKNIEDSIQKAHGSEKVVIDLFKRRKLLGDGELIDVDRLVSSKLSKPEAEELTKACEAHLENLITLCGHTSQMHALDGSHFRQIVSTLWQIPARALRSGSGALAPLYKAPGSEAPHSFFDSIPGKFSPKGATGMTAAIAVIAIGLQHWAAAKDEVSGLRYEHKLNMLHADMFTEEGKKAVYRGGEIKPEHLDEAKCRNMVVLPEATMVQHVADRLDAEIKKLQDKQARKIAAQGSDGLAEMGVEAVGDPAIQARIDAYKKDRDSLRDLTVPDAMHKDTKALLDGALSGSVSFAWGEAVGKLTKPLEFTSQVSQRLGQTFTFGALGSAGATAGGRVASAALGGSSHVSLTVQFALALASMVVGLIAAATQGMVTNVKNQRRDAKPEEAMDFLTQFAKGTVAPAFWASNEVQGARGLQAAGDAFDHFRQQAIRVGESLERLTEIGTQDDIDSADARRAATSEIPIDGPSDTRIEPDVNLPPDEPDLGEHSRPAAPAIMSAESLIRGGARNSDRG